jgi:hypothetical protein
VTSDLFADNFSGFDQNHNLLSELFSFKRKVIDRSPFNLKNKKFKTNKLALLITNTYNKETPLSESII